MTARELYDELEEIISMYGEDVEVTTESYQEITIDTELYGTESQRPIFVIGD